MQDWQIRPCECKETLILYITWEMEIPLRCLFLVFFLVQLIYNVWEIIIFIGSLAGVRGSLRRARQYLYTCIDAESGSVQDVMLLSEFCLFSFKNSEEWIIKYKWIMNYFYSSSIFFVLFVWQQNIKMEMFFFWGVEISKKYVKKVR